MIHHIRDAILATGWAPEHPVAIARMVGTPWTAEMSTSLETTEGEIEL